MLKKNETVRLEITGMTNEGNGVGRAEDIAVFVPMTAVGDVIDCRIVKVMKSYCYGIIDKLIDPSPARIVPDCPVYPRKEPSARNAQRKSLKINTKKLIKWKIPGRLPDRGLILY